jgi:hypothetical protein
MLQRREPLAHFRTQVSRAASQPLCNSRYRRNFLVSASEILPGDLHKDGANNSGQRLPPSRLSEISQPPFDGFALH